MTTLNQATRPAPVIAGNANTNLLKLIALFFMMIDHFGKMLFPAVFDMRVLGRIAFPLYCWCLVVGFLYTRNAWRYCLRLLLVGLVSQPLYMLALNHSWDQPNVFLTLLIALLMLIAVREKWYGSRIWGPALALVLADLLSCDYGWRGVLFVLLLYMVHESRKGLAAVMIAFCLYWGSTSSAVASLFGVSLSFLAVQPIGAITAPFLKLQAFALLAMPFILIPMKNVKLNLPHWVGYALYPAHLAVLLAIEKLMGM